MMILMLKIFKVLIINKNFENKKNTLNNFISFNLLLYSFEMKYVMIIN